MKQHFTIGATEKQIKEDYSPVTIADTEINSLVIDRVKESFPNHTVLGEEESHGNHDAHEFTWVVDPIDGTRPYAMGIPTSVFSLALTKEGEPVLAIVFDPWTDRLYEAETGKGARLNGDRIKIRDTQEITTNTYYSLAGSRRQWRFPLMSELLSKEALVFSTGSFVGESMMVALGQSSFTVFPGDTAHDVATVALIITEAGGFAVDLDGNNQRYDQPVNGLVAGAPGIKEEVLALVKKHREK